MTHVEIEAKMKLPDAARLEKALADAGAERVGGHTEINTFFDTPTGALKGSDQGLRLRIERADEGDRQTITLTHKGPRTSDQLKTRPETELQVTDADRAKALLEALGYVANLSFEKHRTRWRLDDCTVEIDRLPYLGLFVEIEGPSEQAVLAVRRKLDLADLPLIQNSYIAMLKAHLQEHRISTDYIALD